MKIGYYAIIEKDRRDKGFYSVAFPNIFPGVTCGESYDDAVYMAKDLLVMMLTEAPRQCYDPEPYENLRKDYPKRHLVYIEVDVDLSEYYKVRNAGEGF